MISAPDRRHAVELIDEAREAGARLSRACTEIGISRRTYRRWHRGGEICSDGVLSVSKDGRPDAVRPAPRNKLSEAEREEVLTTVHRPEFASLPPDQIVPTLADEEERYLASESSFYRILREADEQHHRGRAKAPVSPGPPATHTAHGPNQVWAWDISWLPTNVRGMFFYLYLVLDLYSRKIVAAEVHEAESGGCASALVRRAVLAEGCVNNPPVLHSDNGGPMKGRTLRTTLDWLQIRSSHSRPRVSNDNAHAEAMFRTCKYRPDYPVDGFADLEAARAWVGHFVRWYNHEHRHSAIKYVTPHERHEGKDAEILARREQLYRCARCAHPERWSRDTRDWTPVGAVTLNPERPHSPEPSLLEVA